MPNEAIQIPVADGKLATRISFIRVYSRYFHCWANKVPTQEKKELVLLGPGLTLYPQTKAIITK